MLKPYHYHKLILLIILLVETIMEKGRQQETVTHEKFLEGMIMYVAKYTAEHRRVNAQ